MFLFKGAASSSPPSGELAAHFVRRSPLSKLSSVLLVFFGVPRSPPLVRGAGEACPSLTLCTIVRTSSPVDGCYCVLHFSLRKGIGERERERGGGHTHRRWHCVSSGALAGLGLPQFWVCFYVRRGDGEAASGYVISLHRTKSASYRFLLHCLIVRRGASSCDLL